MDGAGSSGPELLDRLVGRPRDVLEVAARATSATSRTRRRHFVIGTTASSWSLTSCSTPMLFPS